MRGGGNIGREAGHPCGVVAVNLAHKRGAGPAWMIVLQSIWERDHAGRIAAAGKGGLYPNYGVRIPTICATLARSQSHRFLDDVMASGVRGRELTPIEGAFLEQGISRPAAKQCFIRT